MEEMIAISLVRVPPERQAVDEEAVAGLMDSIRLVGLMHPITLRPDHTLAAGRHRLEACRRLHMPLVPVRWLAGDGSAEATIAEVDENLVRRELSALDRAVLIGRREEAYRALHADQKPKMLAGGFMRELQQQTGRKHDSLTHDRYIAKHFSPENGSKLRGTPYADNQVLLYELARLERAAQDEAVNELLELLARGDSPRGRTQEAAKDRATRALRGTPTRQEQEEEECSQKQETNSPLRFPRTTTPKRSDWNETFGFLERARERAVKARGLKAAVGRLSPAEQETRLELILDLLPLLEDWKQALTPKRPRARKAT
jgi:ParB family transcriptional regulator, chromosome partitioning protein